MKDKSMTKNHRGGITGRRIIELGDSLRRGRGEGILEEQALGKRHGGDIWGDLWEASQPVLGIIGKSCRHPASTQGDPLLFCLRGWGIDV